MIVVENGTGLNNSNSYVGTDYADTYFSNRGITSWDSLTTPKKEYALIRSTDYIDNIFQWNGKKLVVDQSLRFPRTEIYDYEGTLIEGIPECLKQVICEAALVLSQGTELFVVEEANGDVISEKIGDLAFTYSKANRNNTETFKTLYEMFNTRLRGLYKDYSNPNRIITGRTTK